MTSTINQEPSSHPMELLPLYVNGTLPEALQDETRAHVAACPACRGEVAKWEGLAAAVREEPVEVPDPARAWAKLRDRIEQEQRSGQKTAPAAPGWMSWLSWRPQPALAWGMAAAQFLVIIGLAAYIATSRVDEGLWTPLGGPGVESPAGSARLEVIFQERATADEIAEFLGTVEGQIVQGPSAQGVYVIAISDRVAQERGLESVAGLFESNKNITKWVQHETP